ncbi:VTT domain-containing protein [Candidatus Collierbacteria bacterium]|nr:VTT domain-containing protein [Candidatus Collierbacteria bacterium]
MLFGYDLQSLITSIGYLGIFGMAFAESGLFFGFFLPGDSLLFTAGFLASQKIFNIWILLPLITLGAIGGDSIGFWTGRKFGSWLVKQKESFFFQKSHLEAAKRFYDRHGGKTLILARFMPAIRTFAPIVAGMADMHYGSFITYNVIGGLLWSFGLTLLGYFLGSVIPNADKYLLPIIGVIILASVLPAIIHFVKDRRDPKNHE